MDAIQKEVKWEIIREGMEDVLRINYSDFPFPPSIEDNKLCMVDTVDKLIQAPRVARIIFTQVKHYQYDNEQVDLLREIANLYTYFTKQKKFLDPYLYGVGSSNYGVIQYLLLNLLKGDPIGCFVETKRLIREVNLVLALQKNEEIKKTNLFYLGVLEEIHDRLEKSVLISRVKDELDGLTIGNRYLYSRLFRPLITPNFILTRLMSQPPLDGEELDAYTAGDSEIMIFRLPGEVKSLYHLNPPEFKISEDKQELLFLARTVLSEHKPEAEEFIDPQRMRQNFFNIGRDLLTELAQRKGMDLTYDEITELTDILVRYTVGFGLVEVLLNDEKVQDVTINGPIGQTPIFLVHQDFGECVTNIIPSLDEAESWATKFRAISGRPLDEAHPVLDTELIVPGFRSRVAAISRPLNPYGLAYAFRRHRDKPWTLPLFIHNKMISPLGAGLLSFLVDGSRSLLVAGTRSSGKSSLLGSLMVEIMRTHRIITVEDTLELATDSLRQLGYNLQAMKVRAALGIGGAEVTADEGIRTSLRMGDSALIVGEIRSKEALALYEAMRVGALANVVAGTIHGDSPYGVFDRVVNDLGVPRTSFKATDIIIVANPVRSADGLQSVRRVVSITEVRKHWEEDPLREGGFVDLMKYNAKTDVLEPTDALINGDSEIIKAVAGSVKEWAGKWDVVWENIQLRAQLKSLLVEKAVASKRLDLLEASFVVKANDAFHIISRKTQEELGEQDNKRILFDWDEWLRKEMKKS